MSDCCTILDEGSFIGTAFDKRGEKNLKRHEKFICVAFTNSSPKLYLRTVELGFTKLVAYRVLKSQVRVGLYMLT